MGFVIKRGGKKQVFLASKIKSSIQKSARDAGISPSKISGLIKEVAEPVISLYKKKNVKSTALRKSILRRLDRRMKSVSAAWRRYEKNK